VDRGLGVMSTATGGYRRLDFLEAVWISFYGTKCQDRSLPIAHCPLQRRRPLPVGTCGGACPGSAGRRGGACPRSAGKHGEPCALPGRPRVRDGHRSRSPMRRTVAPLLKSCCHWHPRRDRSPFVLAQKAGTILLSGPLLTMASFGTPRGHSLYLGPRVDCVHPWTRSHRPGASSGR